MSRLKIARNPFVIFFPFLLFYIVLTLMFPSHGNVSDENRYLMFAGNLIHGYYSPEGNVDLGTGPGYPIIIAPLLALSLPYTCITLLNAFFYYLSVVFLYKALIKVVSSRLTFIVSFFWALYYNSYENIPLILTEIIASFLVSLLLFTLVSAFKSADPKKRRRYIILSGLVLGYLVLTKVIFGYVLLIMFGISLLLWLFRRSSVNYRRGLVILTIALLTTSPYLAYTHHLTGKLFYWSTFGGNNLYWMSAPFKEEYGSWIKYPLDEQSRKDFISGSEQNIIRNHQLDFDTVNLYHGAQRDDMFKQLAIRNIKAYPVKFIQNCICNAGRMFFNYPYSYMAQKPGTLFRFPLGGILVILLLFSVVASMINWLRIDYPMRFVIFLVCLYLGGTLLGSAETRMLTVAVPAILFWAAYILQRTLRLKMTFEKK